MLNKFQSQLMPYWLQLEKQLVANARLRWMFWGVGYILVFYFALVLNDWRAEQDQALAQLQRTSAKLNQLQHQTQWPERWQQEKEIGEKWRARLWETQSESLAEADLQNFLRRLAADHDLQNYRPRLAPSERITLGGENLIKVAAEVTGSLAVKQADHFLKALADNPKLTVSERFSYSPQRSGALNLQVVAYFLVVEPKPDAEAQAKGGADAAR